MSLPLEVVAICISQACMEVRILREQMGLPQWGRSRDVYSPKRAGERSLLPKGRRERTGGALGFYRPRGTRMTNSSWSLEKISYPRCDKVKNHGSLSFLVFSFVFGTNSHMVKSLS